MARWVRFSVGVAILMIAFFAIYQLGVGSYWVVIFLDGLLTGIIAVPLIVIAVLGSYRKVSNRMIVCSCEGIIGGVVGLAIATIVYVVVWGASLR